MSSPGNASPTTGSVPAASERRSGLFYVVATYLMWGGLPLYFGLLTRSSPFEIVAGRVLFSLVFCLALVSITRQWRNLLGFFRKPKTLGMVGIAAGLIAVNWLLYVIATTTGHTLDASFGYFINPLVAVGLGVIFLGERLRRLQWVAIAVAGLAVLMMSVLYGRVPWLGLGLAFSFGFYGLVKSKVAAGMKPVISLTLETIVLAPFALAFEAWLMTATDKATLFTQGTGYFWLLAASGVITAVPLLTFGAAAARLPLSLIGMIQYMTPTIQFMIAIFMLGETLTPERWIGFVLIWVACLIFAFDTYRAARLQRRAALAIRSRS